MLQKYWSFEEPGDRAARLKKLLVRHLKQVPGKHVDVNALTRLESDYLFEMIFGGKPTDATSRIVSVCLALQDICRFEEIAFASWARQWSECEQIGAPACRFWESLKQWVSALNLSPSQQKWLLHCALASPDWSRLQVETIWGDDCRARLVCDFWKTANQILQKAEDGWLESTLLDQCNKMFALTLESYRSALPGEFLPNAIIIVEGQTEALLLPHFAHFLNTDVRKRGLMIVSAGGAKQIVKRYFSWRDIVCLPIICAFDKDAEEQASAVLDARRDNDFVHIFQAGEIEDTFELNAFVTFLNRYLETFPGSLRPVSAADFPQKGPRKTVLSRLWKDRHLGAFDKIAFAESIVANLTCVSQVPLEVARILEVCTDMVAQRSV